MAGFLGQLFLYLIVSLVGGRFILEQDKRRRYRIRVSQFFSGWMLRGLDVSVKWVYASLPFPPKRSPFLVVANHLSDIDMLILNSMLPVSFVTSVEIRDALLMGAIARAGGSCFVERRNKAIRSVEMDEIQHLLENGIHVCLFPEATTSNGESLLPFKSGFFEAAVKAKATLLPVCLNYRALDGRLVSRMNRDHVFFYGDMGFLGHLWRLCQLRFIEVECRFLPEIPLTGTESRKIVAQQTYQAIEKTYSPVLA